MEIDQGKFSKSVGYKKNYYCLSVLSLILCVIIFATKITTLRDLKVKLDNNMHNKLRYR